MGRSAVVCIFGSGTDYVEISTGYVIPHCDYTKASGMVDSRNAARRVLKELKAQERKKVSRAG